LVHFHRAADHGVDTVLYFTSHEFLRDGDQLAARMTGTIKVDAVDTEFESFMFAKVDKESGKMEWLIERSVWGPVGGASEHGVN
jgi:hypothetical protein